MKLPACLLLIAGVVGFPGLGYAHGTFRQRYSYPASSTAIAPPPTPLHKSTPHQVQRMLVEVLDADRVRINGREFEATSQQRRSGETPSPPDCPDTEEKALTPADGAEFWM